MLYLLRIKINIEQCFLNLVGIPHFIDMSNLTNLTDGITENLDFVYIIY